MCFALIVFVVLLGCGIAMDELGWLHAGLWVLAAIGTGAVIALLQWPFALLCAVIAIMDVVLILVIFKGDLRIR
jgi:hypothetical protein